MTTLPLVPNPTTVERRHPDTPDDCVLATGYIYIITDPSGMARYHGSAKDRGSEGPEATLNRRMCNHRYAARHDPNSTPLYRAAGGDMSGWNILLIRTVHFDEARLPLALLDEEDETRETITSIFPLLNKNRAKAASADRRAYMAAWRAAHPGYMAQKSREHRQRRRDQLAAAAAGQDQ